ncbi:NAD(P)-dependent oxidoreductase [Kiloniella laminariae]|uniref:NAD(P)-dependent oxidoreductase n=1 Tax=Kiloniella laminariae TaxID=454162 RepID=UPI000381F37A|nr:NAD(P)-dependent oxidoreductase [Kiloniella laminariae]
MSDKMLQFVRQGREMPEKRAVPQRREDFREIYDAFTPAAAQTQASRCSQCGVPFCQIHCPLSNNIPDWLMLTANDRLEEAYELSQATNNFPEICGRICPQDRLCEGKCVIQQSGHGTVTIGSVEKYITDTAWEKGWVKPAKPQRELAETVAIIGAGPGGLAAAEQLRRKGYQVHVYDRYDRAGGLLVYGIPGFKLEKNVVERRVDLLEQAGIHFHLGQDIGGTVSFADIRNKHDAVLVATGVYQARDLSLPGSELRNILPALYYLTEANRKDLGIASDHMSDELNAQGKNVVVIGGGDTAMDCVRTAVRQGAKSVKCLYRRDKSNMPGSEREVQNAEEEGVEFVWLSAPEAFVGDEVVREVLASKVHLGIADASGRQVPQIVPDSREAIPADLVIKALGFEPENLPKLFNEQGLEVSRYGTLQVDETTMMTALDGVFAAGDIVRGASLVVWAIKDARDAAEQMHAFIKNKNTAAA